jgi:glycosyltransferase involved in cell wall biosynthesis
MQVVLLGRDDDGALGVYLRRKQAGFLERGADVRVLLDSDGEVAAEDWDRLTSADLIVADVDRFYPLLRVLAALTGGKGRILIDYHGGAESRDVRGILWCADVVAVHHRTARQEVVMAAGLPGERVVSMGLPVGGTDETDRDVPFVVNSFEPGTPLQILNALVSGVPVLAARSGPLPELVGDAGLTFSAGDAREREVQIERMLAQDRCGQTGYEAGPRKNVAVVSFRYGTDFAGGAETSLRTIAEALREDGHRVEVFTTCTRSETHWGNELREGTVVLHGVPVHRFAVDKTNRRRHLESVRLLHTSPEIIPAELEREYVRHSIQSSRLVEALARRRHEWDAVVVGPYLFGLTHEIASRFPDKTLLLPCFHREPLARLALWVKTYSQVAGILYHSREEKDFAEAELGINHPNAVEIGTCLDESLPMKSGNVPPAGRYLVYCGRYSPQKALPRLLEYARKYDQLRPGQFRFVFIGQGGIKIPREPWAVDLGFVAEAHKRQVVASADALIQLSRQESLSLVALEAWAAAVPVLVDPACAVLAGHLHRCGGGQAVGDFADFAAALDQLWSDPEIGKDRGRRGQDYVRQRYCSRKEFTGRLVQAVRGCGRPLREMMIQQGRRRATDSENHWQEHFWSLVEQLLHQPPRTCVERAEVVLQTDIGCVAAGQEVLLPVRVSNRGTHPLAAAGPGRAVVCARVADEVRKTSLPGMVLPGESRTGVVSVKVPRQFGRHALHLWIEGDEEAGMRSRCFESNGRTSVDLQVVETVDGKNVLAQSLLEQVHACLTRAEQHRQLPDDFAEEGGGWFSRWKQWLKRKLLHQFKTGYVDVLSRQQSRVNADLLRSVQQLTETCATLGHAVQVLQTRVVSLEEKHHSASAMGR